MENSIVLLNAQYHFLPANQCFIPPGNIMMLSEGKVGRENVYNLREGILTLHLDKESYERAGLVGKPDGAKGKRGTKPWWGTCLEFLITISH